MSVGDEAIRQLVCQSCLYLDGEDFDAFLSLCAPEFRYQIKVYSPEINKEMIWMDHERKELEALFVALPDHLRLLGKLMRHVSVYLIERNGSGDQASVTSSFVVLHTDPEGKSKLLAGGRYLDSVDVRGETPRLLSRTTRLETRDVGVGWQAPL